MTSMTWGNFTSLYEEFERPLPTPSESTIPYCLPNVYQSINALMINHHIYINKAILTALELPFLT